MITTNDVNKIIKAMANLFYTKEEMDEKFAEQKQSFSNLQSLVEKYVDLGRKNEEERIVLGERVTRAEEWIERASGKIAVKFER
jgi:hypothetical protein